MGASALTPSSTARITPSSEWELVVKADGKVLLQKIIGKETTTDGWLKVKVDLTDYSGKSVRLDLLQQATGPS